MSTTSAKHQNFVSEPMGDKPVTDLAGIGEVLGKRLDGKGFDKVCYLYNMYIEFDLIDCTSNHLTGICHIGSVPGSEEKRRIVSRMVERDVSSKLEASQRLLPVFVGMV